MRGKLALTSMRGMRRKRRVACGHCCPIPRSECDVQQMETRALNFSPGHDKLNIGILGVGDVAWRDYLPELHRLRDRIELGAVCAKHEGRARTAAMLRHPPKSTLFPSPTHSRSVCRRGPSHTPLPP